MNLTWETISYEEDRLDIKLNFNDALAISPLSESDQIMFHIKNSEVNIPLYFTSLDGLQLNNENATMIAQIRR